VQPAVFFEPDVYEASASSLLDLLRRLPPATGTVLVVGHYPALPDLAVALAGKDAAESREVSGLAPATALGRMRAKFPTAAIAVLAVNGPWSELAAGRALLTSFVTPREKYRSNRGQRA
jgi:phosphohistidine phosphatase